MSTQALAPPDTTPSQSLDIESPRSVEARTTLDSSTIWRLRKRGEFPEPIQLSPGRSGYRRSAIDQWLASRTARKPSR